MKVFFCFLLDTYLLWWVLLLQLRNLFIIQTLTPRNKSSHFYGCYQRCFEVSWSPEAGFYSIVMCLLSKLMTKGFVRRQLEFSQFTFILCFGGNTWLSKAGGKNDPDTFLKFSFYEKLVFVKAISNAFNIWLKFEYQIFIDWVGLSTNGMRGRVCCLRYFIKLTVFSTLMKLLRCWIKISLILFSISFSNISFHSPLFVFHFLHILNQD